MTDLATAVVDAAMVIVWLLKISNLVLLLLAIFNPLKPE
jgi:hypothetical protein